MQKSIHFKSKVSRRILTLFILCAMLPIGVLSILSFQFVSNQLKNQSQSRLKSNNKQMGLAIYERLLGLENELYSVAASIETGSFSVGGFPSSYLQKMFKGMMIRKDQGVSEVLFGDMNARIDLEPQGIQHILSGQTLVFSHFRTSVEPSVYMCISLQEQIESKSILISEIDTDYLIHMGYKGILPEGTEYCLLDESGRTIISSLSSSSSFPPDILLAINETSLGEFEWEHRGDKCFAIFRDIFLKGRFFSSRWKLILGESNKSVFAPMAYFRKAFSFVILLALLTALLLSMVQIRKSLTPLVALEKGAKKIARKEFDTELMVKSRDEFALVADSLNMMSRELDHHFKMLTQLADIDRKILLMIEPDKMVDTLLTCLPELFPCDGICVTLMNSSIQGIGKTYTQMSGSAAHRLTSETRFSHMELEELCSNPQIYPLTISNGAAPNYLLPLVQQDLKNFVIFPIFLSQKLSGILVFGSKLESAIPQEDFSHARQLANQVGLALTNAQLIGEMKEFGWGALTALARAIDTKSPWTAGHSERATKLALRIGKAMDLARHELELLHRGGMLHDIGKLGISNKILDKPNKLTTEERFLLQKHPRLGARILEPIAAYTHIVQVVLQHHENYDGTGYPDGLAGEEISLYSQIFAVADRFDALTSERPYRSALAMESAIEMIEGGSGTEFNPEIVDAFLGIINKKEILTTSEILNFE